MDRGREKGYVGPRWEIRSSSFDFRLSAAQPFAARSVVHARPTPARVSVHEGLECTVLLAGGMEVQIDDHLFRTRPGDLWLVSMWEPHVWRVTSRRAEEMGVVFLPEFLGDDVAPSSGLLTPFACPSSQRPMITGPATRRAVLAIGRELRAEFEQKRGGWQTAMRLGIARLLLTLSRDWKAPRHFPKPLGFGSSGLRRIMPALEAVHTRPATRVSLATAAAACGLSAPHFSRVFREIMGLSFPKFRVRARLAYAARLLLTTELPTDAVAAQAGFVDGSHLHKNFVKQYGTAPGQYRREGR